MILVILAGIVGLWLAGNRHRRAEVWSPPPTCSGCPTPWPLAKPASPWPWPPLDWSAWATTVDPDQCCPATLWGDGIDASEQIEDFSVNLSLLGGDLLQPQLIVKGF
jgi:hypothetical protein